MYLKTRVIRNGHQQTFVFSIVTEFTDPEITLYEIIKAQIIILLSFLILLFIIFMFTIRKPRKTIKDLRLKATLITNGKPHERVIVTGQNEFSALAEQFNSMVEQLDSSQNELRQKSELSEKTIRRCMRRMKKSQHKGTK